MGSTPCPLLRGRHSPIPLALLLGRMFSGQNKNKQAEEVYRKALQDFGLTCNDWNATATLLREYIRVVTRRGKLCEAKVIYHLVIQNFILRLGRCHNMTLLLIRETGDALRASGALFEAEQVYQEAILDLDFSMHKENDTLICIMHGLGVVYTHQGRWKDAENFLHAALKGFLDIHQNYFHIRVVTVVLNLGITLREQGKLKDAAQMFQWGSSGLEQALGLYHTDTIDAFDQLAMIHTSTQNFVDAEHALSSSLNGCERLYGKSHERTIQKRADIVALLRDQGKFQEAKAACESLLNDCETLGSGSKSLALNHLGTIHCMAGEFGKAEAFFAAALAGFREYGGQRSPLALLVLYNMGNTYHARGRPDLAESTYRQALAGLRLTVGHNHTASIAAAEMLGLSLMSQNRIADAANICSETLNFCKVEGHLPMTEVHELTAVRFECMTTSRLPAYDEALQH